MMTMMMIGSMMTTTMKRMISCPAYSEIEAVLEEVQPPGHSEVHNEPPRQVHKDAQRGLQGLSQRGPSRGPPGARLRGPPSGPTRDLREDQLEAHPVRDLLEDPTQEVHMRRCLIRCSNCRQESGKAQTSKYDGRVRKAKVQIDPDLFDKDELADRAAAIDWTKSVEARTI